MRGTVPPDPLVSATLGARWFDAMMRRRAREIAARSGLAAALPREGLLLDIGAGLGHLAEAVLAEAPGRRCLGLDPRWSPPAPLAARLRAQMPGRLGWIRGDGMAIPLAEGAVDGVWIAFVLHHLPPDAQRAVLAEARRVLRAGGVFALLEDTPRDGAERARTERADRRLNFEPADLPHHYRAPGEWPALLAAAGLSERRRVSFRRIFPPASLRPVQHTGYICAG